jgi:hypothetical protein
MKQDVLVLEVEGVTKEKEVIVEKKELLVRQG